SRRLIRMAGPTVCAVVGRGVGFTSLAAAPSRFTMNSRSRLNGRLASGGVVCSVARSRYIRRIDIASKGLGSCQSQPASAKGSEEYTAANDGQIDARAHEKIGDRSRNADEPERQRQRVERREQQARQVMPRQAQSARGSDRGVHRCVFSDIVLMAARRAAETQ